MKSCHQLVTPCRTEESEQYILTTWDTQYFVTYLLEPLVRQILITSQGNIPVDLASTDCLSGINIPFLDLPSCFSFSSLVAAGGGAGGGDGGGGGDISDGSARSGQTGSGGRWRRRWTAAEAAAARARRRRRWRQPGHRPELLLDLQIVVGT